MNKQFTIKPMTIEDYDGLHALWNDHSRLRYPEHR